MARAGNPAASLRIVAAGGVGAYARTARAIAAEPDARLDADAQPIALRAATARAAPQVSRLASRFAQLAALGAADCLACLGRAPDPATRIYLATGLGDIAHTDALYYEVMPPVGEMPQPARFATSGNNMAAFFVAQHAGLGARNLTLCQSDLSFERALALAVADLSAGAAPAALVGGVDETALPRAFYTRRYAPAEDRIIGEGSAWLLVDAKAADAQPPSGARLRAVRMLPAADPELGDGAWARSVTDAVAACLGDAARGAVPCLLPGTRLTAPQRELLLSALRRRWPACECRDLAAWTGHYPTAAALAIAAVLGAPDAPSRARRTYVHVNRDDSGRTGLILLELP